MQLFTAFVCLACLAGTRVDAWSAPKLPSAADPLTTPSISSRRGFIATSVTGAVLASNALETRAAVPSTKELVQPNTLNGQVMVITGGTTGLGLESAKMLAKGGATVVVTGRTPQKGAAAVQKVQDFLTSENIENKNIYTVQLDLDDLDNVKSFPKRLKEKLGENVKIDVLMNNAGVMAIPDLQVTANSFERTFQSNHLGHFVLTAKLFPFLKENARVVNVSSLAYQFVNGLDLNNLNGEKDYGPWKSYGQSKLENILFAQELQRRADAEGLSLTVTSLHPGAVNTDLARNMMGGEEVWQQKKATGPTNPFEKFMDATISKALKTPEEGAATQVFLASGPPGTVKGAFYSDLKPQKLPDFAKDEKAAKDLWDVSEKLGGIKFALR